MLRRVGDRTDRPLLARPDRREAIETLLDEREAAYRDCDLEVDTTGVSIEKVAEKISSFIEGR